MDGNRVRDIFILELLTWKKMYSIGKCKMSPFQLHFSSISSLSKNNLIYVSYAGKVLEQTRQLLNFFNSIKENQNNRAEGPVEE